MENHQSLSRQKVEITPDIFTVSEILFPQECAEYIALSESIGYIAAPITTRRFDLRYPYFDITVVPKTGMALCFLHHLRHEGAPVINGRKYVLRSDVMYDKVEVADPQQRNVR